MIFFFDTETNGLPANYRAPFTDVDNWPRAVQLSWILAEESGKLIKEEDHIIKPDGFTVSEDGTRIHGISHKIAEEAGEPITEVLTKMVEDIRQSSLMVGHNVGFDMPVLQAELHRHGMNTEIDLEVFCTMINGTSYCKIPGRYGYKWPRLGQLYRKCFAREMEGAHNALADTRATFECYFYLKEQGAF